jgi:hypothetical protein
MSYPAQVKPLVNIACLASIPRSYYIVHAHGDGAQVVIKLEQVLVVHSELYESRGLQATEHTQLAWSNVLYCRLRLQASLHFATA